MGLYLLLRAAGRVHSCVVNFFIYMMYDNCNYCEDNSFSVFMSISQYIFVSVVKESSRVPIKGIVRFWKIRLNAFLPRDEKIDICL